MHKYIDISDTQGKIDYDYNAILDCVNNILDTQKGSLAMKRSFGLDIERFLFEPFSPHIVPLLKAEIIRSLKINCPHLDKIKVIVEPDPYTETYNVEVLFNAYNLPQIITTKRQFTKIR